MRIDPINDHDKITHRELNSYILRDVGGTRRIMIEQRDRTFQRLVDILAPIVLAIDIPDLAA